MILYLDTSALVKKYFQEKNSAQVAFAWKSSLGIATSAVAYAELLAAVYRKAAEARLKKTLVETIVGLFQEDWASLIVVEVDNRLNELIHRLVATYPLRGFDAIHLASALTIAAAVTNNFVFACYDKRLMNAARVEGLEGLSHTIEI
ncbi:MAG: type II toxin-antitoxin system VapC family toxin [Desulfobacterales bacterium]